MGAYSIYSLASWYQDDFPQYLAVQNVGFFIDSKSFIVHSKLCIGWFKYCIMFQLSFCPSFPIHDRTVCSSPLPSPNLLHTLQDNQEKEDCVNKMDRVFMVVTKSIATQNNESLFIIRRLLIFAT